MRVIHEWTEGRAIISIEGLRETIRVLHLSDSHLGLIDERDAEWVTACQEIQQRFNSQSKAATSQAAFGELLGGVKWSEIDLLALTGDMISFPSKANVEYLRDRLSEATTEVLYIAGNHDWHWPGLDYGSAVREEYRPLLEPLQRGQAAQAVRKIGGVRFVAIDNSDYQITQGQLEFTRENLAAGLPTVVLMHLPISVPGLRAATLKYWGSPILMGDPQHRNPLAGRCCGPPLNPPMTVEGFERVMDFIRLLVGSPNLVAVLCGHIHFAHADSVSPWAMQYVAPAGFEGRCLLTELRPL